MPAKNLRSPLPPKSERSHIPALHPDTLTVLLQGIDTLKISAAAKKQLRDMLKAAANPDNEKVDVIIRTMSKDEQRNIAATTQAVSDFTAATVTRGGAKLMALSDDEWERLLNADENV